MEEKKCCKKDGGSCGEILQVGKVAPKVELEGYYKGEKKQFSYDDYEEKWKILFFYPLDFTFVCPTEIKEFAKYEDEFKKLNTQILSCSIDSFYSHKTWYERDCQKLNFRHYQILLKVLAMITEF